MISKLLIALIVGSISIASYSDDLRMKTVEGLKILDGTYQVIVDKNNKTYINKDGQMTGKKIYIEKSSNVDGRTKIFNSEELLTKGGQHYSVYYLGLQEGQLEHGYFEVKKGKRVVSRGIYDYAK